MKRFLHRHHKSHSPPRSDQEDGGGGGGEARLKASLYEDTTSRSPPRIGSLPIKGNQEVPAPETLAHDPAGATRPIAAPASTTQPGASPQSPVYRASRPEQPREAPTNFSRLPPSRTDAVRSHAATPGALPMPGTGNNGKRALGEGNVPPSPSAIQPQDLTSPEFSYLSNVYGGPARSKDQSRPDSTAAASEMPASNRVGPLSSVPGSGSARIPGTDSSPPYAMPSGSPRQPPPSSMAAQARDAEAPPAAPAVPRKDVSPGQSFAERSGRTSLDHIPASVTNVPDRKPVGHAETTVDADAPSGPAGAAARHRDDEQHAHALDEAAERLKGIVNLNNTADTEVITKEAPAVVHETIVPKVHEIREERIEREIHTHDVIHRIQPVIDVEVLPPRHFVPTESGGLREVSADDIPGRQGHWGIVETVTRNPADAVVVSQSFPTEPQVLKSEVTTSPEGFPRTETVIRHPPTLDTRARDTGQSWPILIDPETYAKRHGLPIMAQPQPAPASAPSQNISSATSTSVMDESRRGAPPGYAASTSARDNVVAGKSTGPADAAPRTEQMLPTNVEPAPATVPVPVPDPRAQALRSTMLAMPGTFPSSNSTTTIKTLQQQQQRP